jgi:hypothetical protein
MMIWGIFIDVVTKDACEIMKKLSTNEMNRG